MSQENLDVVRRAFDLLERDGPAALDEILLELCHPDVEVRSVGRLPDRASTARGRAAVKAWFTDLFATLETRLEVEEYIDAGESVVVVFRQVSRGRASGAELTSRFAFVYVLRNGRLVYMEGYRTREEALEAAGLPE